MSKFKQSNPFELKHLDGRNEKKFVNIRVNKEERELLDLFKHNLRLQLDSTALKLALKIAHNVTQATFSKPILRYLSSERRTR